MFPVDSLPPQYCEERGAAEAARRLAKQQMVLASAAAPTATPVQQPRIQAATASLSQTLVQPRPPMARPDSPGFLGNFLQGFSKMAATSNRSAPPSGSSTPATVTPTEKTQADAMKAASQRDVDICAMRAW